MLQCSILLVFVDDQDVRTSVILIFNVNLHFTLPWNK